MVNGDMLDAKEDLLGHQVNCQSVMGSGIAKLLKDKYPNLLVEYKEYCSKHTTPAELLGKCQIVKVGSKQMANLFGQLNYGRQKTLYTDYEALRTALVALKNYAVQNSLSVALPYNIGCGLANGDWQIVSGIIEEVFSDYEVTLYKL